MSDVDRAVRNLLNAHGFLFQRAVEHELRQKAKQWRVRGSEVYWTLPDGAADGFADLVITRDHFMAVVECKRVRTSNRADVPRWAFISRSDDEPVPWDQDRLAWARCGGAPETVESGWEEFVGPGWPAAEFCVVRGESGNDGTALERWAQGVLRAQGAILPEFARDPFRVSEKMVSVGLPLIVTNARLHLCSLDPAEVSLERGELEHAVEELPEVGAVRFRKPLGEHRESAGGSIEDRWSDSQRTVYVVNASALIESLRQLEPHRSRLQMGTAEWTSGEGSS